MVSSRLRHLLLLLPLLPWQPAPAGADQVFANIPCSSIEGAFTKVGETRILVNSPGQIEFSIPSAQAFAPPGAITGAPFSIDIPITINSQIPNGITYSFSVQPFNVPYWLTPLSSPTISVNPGTTSLTLSPSFVADGIPVASPPMEFEIKGTADFPSYPDAEGASGIAAFGPAPTVPGYRTFALKEVDGYFGKVYLGAWSSGASPQMISRWASRALLGGGYTGTTSTFYEVVPDPNPWFTGRWTREIFGNFSNGDLGTFAVIPGAPLAENVEIKADINLKVTRCQ